MEENKISQVEEIATEEKTVTSKSPIVKSVTKKIGKIKGFVIDAVSKVKTLKNENPKKFITFSGVIAGALVVVVVLCCVFIPMIGNTYKTPLNIELKFNNSRKPISSFEECIVATNGFAKNELKQILSIIEKSDEFDVDELIEYVEEQIENNIDEYGKNYKYKYKILEKEKLEREDIRDFKNDRLKYTAEKIEEFVEEVDEVDSDEIEEAADEIGLTRSEFRKLVKAYEDLADRLKKAEISKGYELEIKFIITGSELEEPIETENTIRVYCINGRWVSENFFNSLYMFTFITNLF